MKVIVRKTYITFWREKNELRISNESSLLYRLKLLLNERGFDFIKKLMWKDGHMVSDTQHYLRARKVAPNRICVIYDGNYAIRDSAKEYNEGEHITFRTEKPR